MKIHPVGVELFRVDGRTDRHDEANSLFSQFCDIAYNEVWDKMPFCIHHLYVCQNGVLLIDYLPMGQTINAEYYSSLLVQLKDILKEKWHGKVSKGGVLFLHHNVPAHRALATQNKLDYLGFQCLNHPPYSPVLAVGLSPVPWSEKKNN